ncbi:ArsR/SmtB family transcription factor [Salinigranum salinum]|uniref:ArsR/SmtB family transcription factor n=1 Tax=Salinigranum salinum TaxID=1364937 RepID=UPI001260EE33|nr:winged helix-turn-helix domain-containing protein [Salinigranum salinum]
MSLNAGLLPHRPPVDEPERDTRVVSLGSEEAASLCGSLASETATSILSQLFEEPTTASDLAECVDTSLQNAHYHLERLRDSDLIRVVDTWYSSRGVEMKVYAPAHDELVIAPGGTDRPSPRDARSETDWTDDQRPDDGETPPLVVGQSD